MDINHKLETSIQVQWESINKHDDNSINDNNQNYNK